ncbi:Retrovirus-related Pol polyprotein from type-1 retrotransposable element R2 [Chionoecetes opilio]|uniref:Retrovirus-related Pol polyprotein from type-1 retrotransposable element R2 n=1 Tax=Chionoecetes opilio TaxID=41210 RepID=A0A8J4YVL9_CHIOP|nr:Retrovirus-related Pol polyprotein from type-1 retrotransposable element R2 [Chionoecetes opilio]
MGALRSVCVCGYCTREELQEDFEGKVATTARCTPSPTGALPRYCPATDPLRPGRPPPPTAGVSSFFPVNTGVRQGCVLAPSIFNACMDWVLDKVVDQSDCGASVGNTKITDLVFADDAVIFAESLEVLVMALEALHEEAKPLGLEVSWLKTKVQVFGDLLDEAVQSVHACGEDIEILESFTYLGSAIHNDGGSRQEALRRIGIAHGVMDSLSGSIWRCQYLCRRTKIRIFKSLVIPVLLYGCETWTLNSDLKRRINAFGKFCKPSRDCQTSQELQQRTRMQHVKYP